MVSALPFIKSWWNLRQKRPLHSVLNPARSSLHNLQLVWPVLANGTFRKGSLIGTWYFQEICSSLIKRDITCISQEPRDKHIINSTWIMFRKSLKKVLRSMGMAQKTIRKSAESQSWSQASIHTPGKWEKGQETHRKANPEHRTVDLCTNLELPTSQLVILREKCTPLPRAKNIVNKKKPQWPVSLFSFTEIMSSLIIKEFKS